MKALLVFGSGEPAYSSGGTNHATVLRDATGGVPRTSCRSFGVLPAFARRFLQSELQGRGVVPGRADVRGRRLVPRRCPMHGRASHGRASHCELREPV